MRNVIIDLSQEEAIVLMEALEFFKKSESFKEMDIGSQIIVYYTQNTIERQSEFVLNDDYMNILSVARDMITGKNTP